MAAPLRTESLGVAEANPVTGNLERSGITQYELLRDKRKASLHAQVQLALATAGVILDDLFRRSVLLTSSPLQRSESAVEVKSSSYQESRHFVVA
jgi:hypothetical protein